MDKKGYTVEVDLARKLCFLKVWGLWDVSDGKAYVSYYADKIKVLKGQKWNVVADISEWPAQKPEVNVEIQETMRLSAEGGMQRAANLVNSAMTQMQIKRISQETGIPEFSFFTSKEAAVEWALKG